MTETGLKRNIENSLKQFSHNDDLASSSMALLEILGYRSEKRIPLSPNTPDTFLNMFNESDHFNTKNAHYEDWVTVDFLFQLTDEEINLALSSQGNIFRSKKVDQMDIRSYLFFVIYLRGEHYTRTQLATITREVNKLFLMPVMVLFRYDEYLTISIISRRMHKRVQERDVLEKVTLIKDICISNPNRAHKEILYDLSMHQLQKQGSLTNFSELQKAWEKVLDTSVLNKRFYRDIAYWYFWAKERVVFPEGAGVDVETRNATSVIRLITRLIFIWFIKEKGILRDDIFNKEKLRGILNNNDPKGSTYYKAILQNLFFATLNQEMNTPGKQDKRYFRTEGQHYNITNLYRYKAYFNTPDQALRLFENIPFLNGGLFECLDKYDKNDTSKVLRVDGFSDRSDNPLVVPDELFFSPERDVDLNEVFGTRNKIYKVRGLIYIFESYKFTVEENTPIEEEIALDPELLGKVFENLLAAYNPETGTTARKQTGSYYTPREIVNYMVDESLLTYMDAKLQPSPDKHDPLRTIQPVLAGEYQPALLTPSSNNETTSKNVSIQERLRHLLAYNDDKPNFDEKETEILIQAIDEIKVLDPACGSGAFPMGILHKLVFILAKLDPENVHWRELQRQKAIRDTEEAYQIGDKHERRQRLLDIDEAFENNTSDFGRKLYLIENCIYGVDIQPIAVQIAKLRFFISLVVDQKFDLTKYNLGIRPLPNLETRFVAANTLIDLEKPRVGVSASFGDHLVASKRTQLTNLRHKHFTARTPKTKRDYREKDKTLREEISTMLKEGGWKSEIAAALANWDPYDQNASAEFFNPEWMFGISDGFNIVLGNPPYVRVDELKPEDRGIYHNKYECSKGKYDLYYLFFEKSTRLLNAQGTLSFITPNKYCAAISARSIRKMILNNYSYQEIVSTSLLGVFEDVANYPVISIFSNSRKNDYINVRRAKSIDELNESTEASYILSHKDFSIFPEFIIPINVSKDHIDLAKKLLTDFPKIGEYLSISEGLRIPEKYEQLSGDVGIVKQYQFEKWTAIREGSWISKKDLSNVISKNSDRYKKIIKDKILIAEDALIITATLDKQKLIPQGGVYFGTASKDNINLIFILAVLNSRLISFLYQVLFSGMHMGGGYLRYRTRFLEELPFPNLSTYPYENITDYASQILGAKCVDSTSDISILEAKIDNLIYQLFGLSNKEISMLEGVFDLEPKVF